MREGFAFISNLDKLQHSSFSEYFLLYVLLYVSYMLAASRLFSSSMELLAVASRQFAPTIADLSLFRFIVAFCSVPGNSSLCVPQRTPSAPLKSPLPIEHLLLLHYLPASLFRFSTLFLEEPSVFHFLKPFFCMFRACCRASAAGTAQNGAITPAQQNKASRCRSERDNAGRQS